MEKNTLAEILGENIAKYRNMTEISQGAVCGAFLNQYRRRH